MPAVLPLQALNACREIKCNTKPAMFPLPCSMADMTSSTIAIGGFSGAILAINLLRHDGPSAVVIEPRPKTGEELA